MDSIKEYSQDNNYRKCLDFNLNAYILGLVGSIVGLIFSVIFLVSVIFFSSIINNIMMSILPLDIHPFFYKIFFINDFMVFLRQIIGFSNLLLFLALLFVCGFIISFIAILKSRTSTTNMLCSVMIVGGIMSIFCFIIPSILIIISAIMNIFYLKNKKRNVYLLS